MELYYVYYAIQKNGEPKVGCTSQVKRRFKKYIKSKLLEVYNCPKKAGDREIQLQELYFGKRDSKKHYTDLLNNTEYFTKESYKKISNSSKEMWKDPTRKEKNLKGSKVGTSILTEKEVKYIKNTYIQVRNQNTPIPKGKHRIGELANMFNVHRDTIRHIIQNKNWAHI